MNHASPEPWSPPAPLPVPIRTPRLTLRWFEESDAGALFEAVNASRDTLLPWLPWAERGHRTIDDSLSTIRHFATERADTAEYTIGIFDTASGTLLGATGLHRFKLDLHSAETGYWLRADARGTGICTEATRHLISAAFMPKHDGGFGLRRIEIICAGPNAASAAIPQRLGLEGPARLRRERFVPGHGWVDSLIWDVLADEWNAIAHERRA